MEKTSLYPKLEKELKIMREGGLILSDILKEIINKIKPQISTYDLDIYAKELILKKGGFPAFYNYKTSYGRYKHNICISLNNEIVHGKPLKNKILKSGDIISIDIGIRYPAKNGFYLDMAYTTFIPEISENAKKLIEVTKLALKKAISKAKPGNFVVDLSKEIQRTAYQNGFNVVKSLVGHGIGYKLHEPPQIPNFVPFENFKGEMLIKNLTLAIEPMLIGSKNDKEIIDPKDNFTVITQKGNLSAHFEQTIIVRENKPEILTPFKFV